MTEHGRSAADAASGCQPTASAASFTASSQSGIPNAGIWDRLGDGDFRRGYVQESVQSGLGDQLLGLMRSRGLSAAQVAKAAKVKRDDVVAVITGNFAGRLNVLQKIAAVFDVAVGAKFLPYSEALAEYGYIPSFAEEAPPEVQSERTGA